MLYFNDWCKLCVLLALVLGIIVIYAIYRGVLKFIREGIPKGWISVFIVSCCLIYAVPICHKVSACLEVKEYMDAPKEEIVNLGDARKSLDNNKDFSVPDKQSELFDTCTIVGEENKLSLKQFIDCISGNTSLSIMYTYSITNIERKTEETHIEGAIEKLLYKDCIAIKIGDTTFGGYGIGDIAYLEEGTVISADVVYDKSVFEDNILERNYRMDNVKVVSKNGNNV